MDKKKISGSALGSILAFLALAVAILYSAIDSYTSGKNDYFVVPFYAALNIGIAIFVAYMLNQRQNDRRRRRDAIERVVNKLLTVLDDPSLVRFDSKETVDYFRLAQRSIFNRISQLYALGKDCKIKYEVDYIKTSFEAMWELCSDNIEDLECLKKLEMTFERHRSNIVNKLEEIFVKLYT